MGETYYDVLSLKEDATYHEIRSSYRCALLNVHPDKSDSSSAETYFKVQKAWEVLSSSTLRAAYDRDLHSSKGDALETITLQDMDFQHNSEIIQLFYQCRCGDHFFIDSVEMEEMGYSLFRDSSKVSLRKHDALPASIVLPCNSCSLKIRLLID